MMRFGMTAGSSSIRALWSKAFKFADCEQPPIELFGWSEEGWKPQTQLTDFAIVKYGC